MTKKSEATHCATAYGIERHSHLFAAWAAGRAAPAKGYRFRVIQGREILEAAGFTEDFSGLQQLSAAADMDKKHRQWRGDIIQAAGTKGLTFSHGVAAKLINIYLKSRFVCGGRHGNKLVRNLHPPIDRVLLTALAERNIGGYAKEWRKARQTGWSKFTSEDYENLIAFIRQSLKGKPLWKIEEYWAGNQ